MIMLANDPVLQHQENFFAFSYESHYYYQVFLGEIEQQS